MNRLRACRCGGVRNNGKCDRCGATDDPPKDNRPHNSRTWRTFRARFLRMRPLCEDCMKAGRTTPANEVHHKIKVSDEPDRLFDGSICMALCASCHARRTARGE